jgi:hypothetical protein
MTPCCGKYSYLRFGKVWFPSRVYAIYTTRSCTAKPWKTEGAKSPETSVTIYQSARSHISEDVKFISTVVRKANLTTPHQCIAGHVIFTINLSEPLLTKPYTRQTRRCSCIQLITLRRHRTSKPHTSHSLIINTDFLRCLSSCPVSLAAPFCAHGTYIVWSNPVANSSYLGL